MDNEIFYSVYGEILVSSQMHLATEAESNLIAFGRVIINNMIVIENVRVMKGPYSNFISMPQYRKENGLYGYYLRFENPELYQYVCQQIIWNVAYLEAAKRRVYIEVDVTKIHSGNLLGIATVRVDRMEIHGIKIIRSKGKNCVFMPQYKGKDIVYPANAEIRKSITNAVLKEYESMG